MNPQLMAIWWGKWWLDQGMSSEIVVLTHLKNLYPLGNIVSNGDEHSCQQRWQVHEPLKYSSVPCGHWGSVPAQFDFLFAHLEVPTVHLSWQICEICSLKIFCSEAEDFFLVSWQQEKNIGARYKSLSKSMLST
jgi:hypothetical protein